MCRYGGVYMDMDVIVLKPLDSLHNAIGSEILANGEVRLNGAVMVFNKSRSAFDHAILLSCSL
jgi:lactosylceramide 4-alpha-galactosyltransferase